MAAITFDDLDAPPKARPAKAPSYIPTSAFTSELDQTLGKGKWRDTGDYRSPAREEALRLQGAGTVAPGRTSNHSRGTPEAPGAHDIVAPGVDPAKLRGVPGVRDAFYEGASGTQGGHIHIDTDQGPVTFDHLDAPAAPKSKGPVTFDHLDAQPAAPRPAPRPAPPAQPPTRSPNLLDDVVGSEVGAVRKLGSDVSAQMKKGKGRTSWGDVAQTAGDVAGLVTDPIGGTWEHLIVRPGGAAYKGLANAALGAISPKAEKTHPITTEQAEHDVGLASQLIGPGKEPVVPGERPPPAPHEPITTDPALPKTDKIGPPKKGARPNLAPPEGRPPVVGHEPDPIERVDNALYRLGGNAQADKIEATQALRAVPKEIADPKVQEELTHAIEQKMVDPNAEIPEHLQAAEAVRKPWADRQLAAINRIRKMLADKGMTDKEIEDYLPDSGYVPRRVVGKSPGLDPRDPDSGRNPLAWKGRPPLSKTTGSMKARDQIVFENEAGERTFEHRNPTNEEWKAGMEVRHPVTGERGTVRQATIAEIEGAGALDSKGNPLTYHKNALVNTVDEALKTERVERNLQVLDELTNQMKEEGLAHRTEWHYKNDDGQWVRAKANQPPPEGFKELPHIPQLKGWAFDPKVAEVLKDYYPEDGEPIDNVISTINRALNASLFITPFPHIKNVATMGFVGRGWDWIPGGGNYGRMMKSGAKAIKGVLTMDEGYRAHLREGSGLMAGDEATRNFHQAMLEMAANGMRSNAEKIGKAAGLNPVEAAKALYNVSHKILWNVNDMILYQRQLELQAKGMSRAEAIKESEKWIANYRVPPQVFKSRAFKQFITNGQWINFGRYTYGKWRAIGEMAKGLVKGDPKEKADALGKVVAMGVAGLFIYPMLDALAKKMSGNPNARVPMGGELAPLDAMKDLATGEKDWASAMASFATPAPLVEHGLEAVNNRDLWSGQNLVDPQASPKGKAIQAGEQGAGLFYPAELGMEAMRPGGAESAAGRFLGVSLPQHAMGAMKGSTRKMLNKKARKRERNDPVEQFFGGGG